MNPSLYIVVLGGKVNSTNIEQHDVRWVVGKSIDHTYRQLENEWIGSKNGLHIDSYMKVDFIDGFRIALTKDMPQGSQSSLKNKPDNINQLWFVNLGAYDPCKLYEIHEFTLVVSSSAIKAKQIALKRCLGNLKLSHKDNISSLQNSHLVDNCKPIKNINGWLISLEPDPLRRSQEITPDFYGFLPICNSTQFELPLKSIP